ncbi:MAG: hypothetical protein JNM13_15680 [Hyphomicrobiaceae bacterium]|nr:hypothetical protein [Hyphomicrobiaceae bacterium]
MDVDAIGRAILQLTLAIESAVGAAKDSGVPVSRVIEDIDEIAPDLAMEDGTSEDAADG